MNVADLVRRAHELHAEQRDVEAVRCLKLVLAAEPQHEGALYLAGHIALANGDYPTGLPLYEIRHGHKDRERWGSGRYAGRSQWDGKPSLKRLLLWAEQGHGDSIQMLRYLPMVRRRCSNVILEVQPELVRLCEVNRLATTIVEAEYTTERLERFDMQCGLMSLPFVLGTTLASIPSHVPYLRPPLLTTRTALPDGPRIGLVWKSNQNSTKPLAARSLTDEQIKPLTDEFNFVSLQLEHNYWRDWADTATIVRQLDLVITTDTGIAHLAGAMGKPTWLMLPVNCDWRWLQTRTDSPWYPTMRLYRQCVSGDWSTVLADIARDLRNWNVQTAVA